MKRIIAVILTVLLLAFSLTACKTRADVKPENDTTTPNATVRFI